MRSRCDRITASVSGALFPPAELLPTPLLHVLQWVMYLESEDAKYAHWTAEECSSRLAAAVGKGLQMEAAARSAAQRCGRGQP